ncbi:unnamed protein product [Parascedosporium putredinis]|uniref:Gastric mucin-like protein n=1 Tax=Parascedosporium putredinis TaxID=1442378 RepID=A0A9P1H8V6_9PEZI|nr:unnamed protein product [Parascedosporium putredinis]CAI8001113.1 unnamed protein product [Parascedosporium putredinis]
MTTPGRHGKVVAFEGSSDSSVCTQLRLLPVSPQILILPSLENYLLPSDPRDRDPARFHAPTFVRSVHDAAAARMTAALSFLNEGSPDAKRLVFLNGGTPPPTPSASAPSPRTRRLGTWQGPRTASGPCNRNNDDDDKDPRARKTAPLLLVLAPAVSGSDELRFLESFFIHDPITTAMRAADALDRQTESLQPSTVLDLTPAATARRPRPRSMSLPIYGFLDNLGDSAPFFVFGARSDKLMSGDESSPRLAITSFYDEPDDTDGLDSCLASPSRTARRAAWAKHRRLWRSLHPAHVLFAVPLPARQPAEGHLLDRASTRSGARLLELSLRLSSTTTQINHWFEDLDDIKRFSNPNVGSDKAAPASPSSVSPSYGGGGLPTSSAFVVRPATATPSSGTDAEVAPSVARASIEPVLPFTEDLVVYFKNGRPDSVLDRVVRSLKRNTAYGKQQPPVVPVVADVQREERIRTPARPVVTPTKQESPPVRTVRASPSIQTTSTTDNDEYDPFSYQNQPSWMSTSRLTMSTTITTKTTISSPGAQQRPFAHPRPSSSRIHEFDVTGSPTALAVQNGLRSLLSKRFPAAENGFRQFSFHPLPELDGFWRPIFPGAVRDRDARPGQDVANSSSNNSSVSVSGGRIVDQIIAFGAQTGVPETSSPASRLDFRYLVANAMQAFTAQPLAKQTDENPFANPYLLATLVIPHLETYLAAHCEVRLLVLEYPSEHLATVLAMQRLLGLDLMKVAQIIAADHHSASGNHLFGPLRGARSQESSRSATPTKWPSTHYYGVSSSPSRSAENLTPATANYLLTSRATEAEVSTFLSTISAVLAAISPLYADSYYYAGGLHHQHEQSRRLDSAGSAGPSSMGSPAMSPPPSGATFSAIPHLTVSSQSPLLSPASLPHYGTSSPSIYRSAKHLPLEPEDEGVGLDIDDGSDYEDLEEKRLMPIFMRRSTARKSDSHKALKFLGLA